MIVLIFFTSLVAIAGTCLIERRAARRHLDDLYARGKLNVWFTPEERMPEGKEVVICYGIIETYGAVDDDGERIESATWGVLPGWYFDEGGKFVSTVRTAWAGVTASFAEVSHWIPMPQAPCSKGVQ